MSALIFCAAATCADAAGPDVASEGFTFCVAPRRPACAADEATWRSPGLSSICKLDVARYIDTVFGYRDCLEREIKRAIQDANDTSGLARCKASGRKTCP